ncbi:amidohydrolase family protein [Dyella jiangningensis]|uniref:amidohydrolase family protein n=1 Tax=Dyella jiangningensis TaxID=1379159 RepID=UPI00240FEF5E|nr:amidohydrolase family protein [Dyella jiangningensis]MDG2537707.1 amidohydrolase family protein [Dyella jiangningensis]
MKLECAVALVIAGVLASASSGIHAQSNPANEEGTFVLHKFARAIGKETYTLDRKDGQLQLTSDFLFTDRGTPVPLKTDYRAANEAHPLSLTTRGKSSRSSDLNDDFAIDATRTHVSLVRDGKKTLYPANDHTFLMDGYSPVAMQQMLMRYWLSQGRPARIAAPPGNDIHIQPTSDLHIKVADRDVTLHGYQVSGLAWGSEALWMDDNNQLAALVTRDAEFDHFEAVREAYEPALGTFIQRAANDGLASLAQLAAKGRQPIVKRLVVTNVTLIDGTGAPAQDDVAVFMDDGRISRIAHATDHASTKGYEIVDGHGKFLIPGLWDMHAHYEQVEWGPVYLASGVTTVRDCGNVFDFITAVRDAIDQGRGIGPRILIAGVIDGTGPITLGAVIADTPEQAKAWVKRYKDVGARQIKIYSSMKPELVPVITAEAHRLGMTVTGHVPEGMTSEQVVKDGYDGINHVHFVARDLLHMERNKPLPPLDFTTPDATRQLALFREHHTVIDDTIVLFETQMHPQTTPLSAIEPGITHVAPELAAALDSPGVPPERAKRYDYLLATLRELHRQGLPIVAGTDQAIPGYSLHRELEIYVQAGFTPMEALMAATSVPARVMGLDKEVGTLTVGKRADMVLLDGDPLADIHNTRRIAKTIEAGAVYDPAPLWQSVGFTP